MNGTTRTKPPESARAESNVGKAQRKSNSALSNDSWISQADGRAGRSKKAPPASAPATGKQVANRKYSNVQTMINSGSSATNYAKHLANKDGRKKDGELFSRMKPLTFARLLLETSKSHELKTLESRAVACSATAHRHPVTRPPSPPRVRPGSMVKPAPPGHVNDVLIGKGSGGDTPVTYNDPPASATGQPAASDMLPYLLMDARSPEEWMRGHLVGACCYPAAMRTRASGPIASKELMAYCNRDGKYVLVYDEDEREAALLAQSLAERGVTNCYLLSGGLKAIVANGIEGIFVGELPESCKNLAAALVKTGASSTATAATPRTYSAYGSSGFRTFSGLENTSLYRSGVKSGKTVRHTLSTNPILGRVHDPVGSATSSRLEMAPCEKA